MKVVILSAGKGTRLRPYTDQHPKAMVELWGRSIVSWQLQQLYRLGLKKSDICIVTGYKYESLEKLGLATFHNACFNNSNMLTSLFHAADFFRDKEEDLLILYGDVLCSDKVLTKVLSCTEDIVVPGNKNWETLWKQRMDSPLEDIESFVYDERSLELREIGQKVSSYENVLAQYMGIILVRMPALPGLFRSYEAFLKKHNYAEVNNCYLTDFLNDLLTDCKVSVCICEGGWIEVDSTDDLHLYEQFGPGILGFNQLS